MNTDEKEAIGEAFKLPIIHKTGNRLTITCKTRTYAVLQGKWKGVQEKGTFTQNPLPECFTNTTWKNTHDQRGKTKRSKERKIRERRKKKEEEKNQITSMMRTKPTKTKKYCTHPTGWRPRRLKRHNKKGGRHFSKQETT